MISKKEFVADGIQFRFLSDFIIRSEQFARVYNYVYDPNGIEGDIDPSTGLFIRVLNKPNSVDLVTIDKWDLVDNSISFYTPPQAGTQVYFEVATTAEEFGDTLIQPAVERAENAADAAEASEIAAAASEAAAALSEAAAALSETNAAASEAAALASQTAAALSESNASASETAAGLSEAAAALSEAAAALSETNAAASETAAAASAAAALASQNAAAASAAASLASENKAEKWAEEADNVAVEAGQYSAKHWANVATQAPSINTFKNKIIDGNMNFWNDGTSFTNSSTYTADMWVSWRVGYLTTHTRQGFIVGTTDVPNTPKYYHRTDITASAYLAGDYSLVGQHIEDVSTLSGKTVTLSFYARVSVASNISVSFDQYFGTGGSPSATVTTPTQLIPVSATWTKCEVTITLPTITGKTLGTDGNDYLGMFIWFGAGSDWDVDTSSLGHQSGLFDIAQVQLEEGSTATPFEQRPIGLETSLCQRYYETGSLLRSGVIANNTTGLESENFSVTKRISPSIITTASALINFTGAVAHTAVVSRFSHYPTGGTSNSQGRYQLDWTADARL